LYVLNGHYLILQYINLINIRGRLDNKALRPMARNLVLSGAVEQPSLAGLLHNLIPLKLNMKEN